MILGNSWQSELGVKMNLLVEGEKVKEVEADAAILLLRGREVLDLGEVVVVALEDGNVPLKLRDVLVLHTQQSCALVGIT